MDPQIVALIDSEWYLQAHPDVAGAGGDPRSHFEHFGMAEGRDPGPWFESDWYLRRYHDVDNAGLKSFAHYLEFGMAEGRYPNPQWEHRDLLAGTGQAPRSPAQLAARIAGDPLVQPPAPATTYPESLEASQWARLIAARSAAGAPGGASR